MRHHRILVMAICFIFPWAGFGLAAYAEADGRSSKSESERIAKRMASELPSAAEGWKVERTAHGAEWDTIKGRRVYFPLANRRYLSTKGKGRISISILGSTKSKVEKFARQFRKETKTKIAGRVAYFNGNTKGSEAYVPVGNIGITIRSSDAEKEAVFSLLRKIDYKKLEAIK